MSETYIIGAGIDASRAIENPNIPLGSPEIFNEVFNTNISGTGISVSPERALSIAPVFQAVNLISGDVAKLPLNVYQRRPDLGNKGRAVADNHAAQHLIKFRPNAEMSAFKFWRRLMTHALLWSNAYALIERDDAGRPVALLPLLPDRTSPQRAEDGSLFYVSEIGGELQGFAASNILHIEQISVSGLQDCQLIYKARESFALAIAAEQFASKYFSNGGRIGGILEMPAGMQKQGADNLEAGFRKTYDSIDASFKTVILRDGAKFHQAQFTPEQTQMTAARTQQVREVARWFNIPPHKLGDDARASYNSLEQENRSYLNHCLSAWLKTIESECYLKLLAPLEQEANSHFIEFNVGALIAADISTQYQIYRTGIEAGILSPDEVRAMQNLNPRTDGLGGKYLRPLNMEYADFEPEVVEAEPSEAERGLEENSYKVLDASVARFAGYLSRKVIREGNKKNLARFMTWIESHLDEEKKNLRDEVKDAIELVAVITGKDVEALQENIARHIFGSMGETIEGVLTTTETEQRSAALKAVLKDFTKDILASYRRELDSE
jgi:HK97 family phage portal protein